MLDPASPSQASNAIGASHVGRSSEPGYRIIVTQFQKPSAVKQTGHQNMYKLPSEHSLGQTKETLRELPSVCPSRSLCVFVSVCLCLCLSVSVPVSVPVLAVRSFRHLSFSSKYCAYLKHGCALQALFDDAMQAGSGQPTRPDRPSLQ